MKLTKEKLKQIIKEEFNNVDEMNEPWFEITYKDSRGRTKTDSMRAKNPKEAKKDFVNLMKGRGFKVLKVVKEEKLNEDSMSPSFRRMWNALDNVIPMVFPDSMMLAGSNNPIPAFKQKLQVGDTSVIKEWPKIEKWINKKFKEIKLSKIKDDQQMLKVLSKTAKGMKV